MVTEIGKSQSLALMMAFKACGGGGPGKIETLKLWWESHLYKCFKNEEPHTDAKCTVLSHRKFRSGFWSINSGHEDTKFSWESKKQYGEFFLLVCFFPEELY